MRLAAVPIVALSLIACSGQAQGPKNRTGDSTRANIELTAPPFAKTELGRFEAPFALAILPDGSALVTEKGGALKYRLANGSTLSVSGVPAVATGGQGGLLGAAIAPDFARSRTIYLTYAEPGPSGSQLAMGRGTLASAAGAAAPELRNFQVIWRSGSAGKGGQFGAVIAFAPDGRSLFLTSGERQRFTPAQDESQALGKILHLTLDGKPAPGNPMAGRTGAATVRVFDPPKNTGAAANAPARVVEARQPNITPAETWSTGHRNPYGLVFAADGRLWEVEMGPKGGDELNLIRPSRNYGWPLASNGDNYDGSPIPDHRPGDGFEPPKLWWNPSISPGGLLYYTGTMFPQYRGSLFIAALSGEALLRVAVQGDAASAKDAWNMGARIRAVAQAPDGAIWVLEDGAGARLWRLTPAR